MIKRKRIYMVSIYSIAHFCVDFACAFLMFRRVSKSPDWYLCILLYNFCAFAMQAPLGILADRLNRNSAFAGIGCALLAVPYAFTSPALAAAVMIGTGNGMFHIGGGVDILNISEEKCGALGVFVSPGAFGVYLGTLYGKGGVRLEPLIIAALLFSALVIFFMRRSQGDAYKNNAPFYLGASPDISPDANADVLQYTSSGAASNVAINTSRGESPNALSYVPAAAACFFLVVVIRSCIGLSVSFPWKATGQWAAALVCATALGKAAGGFLSDRFGLTKAAVCSLGLAAVMFLIPGKPAAGVTSILLFNMTMPITLWAMAKLFPGAKGFSFGLLTFGLFLGFLPSYLGFGAAPYAMPPILAAVSLALLIIGLRPRADRGGRRRL